jgi:hypothetical protein
VSRRHLQITGNQRKKSLTNHLLRDIDIISR